MARTLGYLTKKKMKKLGCLLLVIALNHIHLISNGQDSLPREDSKTKSEIELRSIDHNAFQVGEKLEFKLAYGIINAGVAIIEVRETTMTVQDRKLLHIVGTGKSVGGFDWFFKVRDRYETYIDEDGVFPWLFIRRINEGGYKKAQDYKFFQNKGYVVNQKKETYEIPHGVQDMLSSFYYARTIDFSNIKKGDTFEFDSFVDEEIYPLKVRFSGYENIDIKKGKFRCMVFNPVVQEGRVFKTDDDLMVYISADENKIPVLVKAKVLVGSIRMELTDYENLANPIAKLN